MLEYLIIGLTISWCANLALAMLYWFAHREMTIYRKAFQCLLEGMPGWTIGTRSDSNEEEFEEAVKEAKA